MGSCEPGKEFSDKHQDSKSHGGGESVHRKKNCADEAHTRLGTNPRTACVTGSTGVGSTCRRETNESKEKTPLIGTRTSTSEGKRAEGSWWGEKLKPKKDKGWS